MKTIEARLLSVAPGEVWIELPWSEAVTQRTGSSTRES